MSGLLLRRRGVIAASAAPHLFSTDFSEYTTDQQPADWTDRLNTDVTWAVREKASTIGGKTAELSAAGIVAGRALSWDRLDGSDAIEAVAKIRTSANLIRAGGVALRGSASAAYLATLSTSGTSSSRGVRLFRITDTGSVTEIGFHQQGVLPNQWWWVRFQAIGTALKVRLWQDGSSEPGTWQIEVTDSNFASGWAGIGNSVGGSLTVDWDWFGVALGGEEEAPTP